MNDTATPASQPESQPESDLGNLELAVAGLQTALNAADRRVARRLAVGSMDDLHVLRLLLRNGPQRVGVLARVRDASKATVSAQLDRLEKRGLITRDRVPGDRRSVAATLTGPGRAAAVASRQERYDALAAVEQPPSIAALARVIDALSVERDEQT